MYLRLCADHQVLIGHLNRLIGPSKMSGVHKALLTSCLGLTLYHHTHTEITHITDRLCSTHLTLSPVLILVIKRLK